jgi:hypothetical protein
MRSLGIAVGLLLACGNAWGAYFYHRTITLGFAANSDQPNFPVLIQLDSSNAGTTMKIAGSGGHIQNTATQAGGAAVTMPTDLIFTSDSGGNTKIPWEVETYDGTNGILKAWVKVGTLTTATSAIIYVFYGDAAVTTQQNTSTFAPSAVWDSNFKALWHFPDGSTLSTADSTSGGKALTNNAGVAASTGKVDGGATTSATQWLSANDSGLPASGSPFTISAWYNTTTLSASNILLNWGTSPASQVYLGMYNLGNGKNAAIIGTGGANIGGSVDLNDGVWHCIAGTFDGIGGGPNNTRLYVDGVQVISGMLPWNITLGGANKLSIGRDNGGGQTYAGVNDEIRISDTNRSADWIATDYASMNAPLTFNSVGAEAVAGAATAARRRVIQ